jgi:chitinase
MQQIALSTVVCASLAFTSAAWASQVFIYDDTLAANWQDKSWVTHDLANTSPVSTGTHSISVDYTPWTAISFYLPAGVSTAGAANLEFDVNGGTSANQAIAAVGQITLNGAWGPEVNIAPYCAGGGIPAGAFTHCKVPLSVLQVANTTFQRIALKEVGGLTLPRMYFDAISVVAALPASIYGDALATNWQDKSWVTHDLANASPVSAGTRSISVDYTAWTAISFYLPAGVTTTGAANLEFDVNGGTTANQAIAAVGQITLNGAWGPEVNIAPYCAGGAIPAQ